MYSYLHKLLYSFYYKKYFYAVDYLVFGIIIS